MRDRKWDKLKDSASDIVNFEDLEEEKKTEETIERNTRVRLDLEEIRTVRSEDYGEEVDNAISNIGNIAREGINIIEEARDPEIRLDAFGNVLNHINRELSRVESIQNNLITNIWNSRIESESRAHHLMLRLCSRNVRRARNILDNATVYYNESKNILSRFSSTMYSFAIDHPFLTLVGCITVSAAAYYIYNRGAVNAISDISDSVAGIETTSRQEPSNPLPTQSPTTVDRRFPWIYSSLGLFPFMLLRLLRR